MKPLSIFKYYINSKKRFIPVFTAIFLGVFLLYSMQMLVDSSYKNGLHSICRTTEILFADKSKGKHD